MSRITDKKERRRSRRTRVLLMGAIGRDDDSCPVRVMDVSDQGSRIECRNVGGAGEWVEFRRNDIVARGRVVWARGQQSGLEFEAPIDITQLLRRVVAPRLRPRPPSWRPPVTPNRLRRAEQNNVDWWANCLGVVRAEPSD